MQDGRGHYVLGDEFLRLAFAHHEARPEHIRVRPILDRLSERFSETIHFAVLDGTEVVYRAKVDPLIGAVRLTSTIGGRNPAHCTGVGKVLLASRLHTLDEVERWIGDRQLEKRTANSPATALELHARLVETTRTRLRDRRPGERARHQLPCRSRLSRLSERAVGSREHQRASRTGHRSPPSWRPSTSPRHHP